MKGRDSFSKTLNANNRKVDNHPKMRAAKIELRYKVLTAIGRDKARVFDAFAGAGGMYRAVWRKAALGYVGCDTRWFNDGRLAYVADNRRVLRTLDLQQFSIIDCDAYGSPWEALLIIAARRPIAKGERFGLVITERSGLKLKLGGMPSALAEIAGVVGTIAGAARNQDELLQMAIDGFARRSSTVVLRRWLAASASGSNLRYVGLVLEGA